MSRKMESLKLAVVMVVFVLFLLAAAGWAAWSLMAGVPPDWARAWALLATVLLPAAGWAGYRLGLVEARGRMRGIGEGLNQTVKAATAAIDLRRQAAQAMQGAGKPEPPAVDLPPVEFVERRQLDSGEVEM
jgi:hypothetical protein